MACNRVTWLFPAALHDQIQAAAQDDRMRSSIKFHELHERMQLLPGEMTTSCKEAMHAAADMAQQAAGPQQGQQPSGRPLRWPACSG